MLCSYAASAATYHTQSRAMSSRCHSLPCHEAQSGQSEQDPSVPSREPLLPWIATPPHMQWKEPEPVSSALLRACVKPPESL